MTRIDPYYRLMPLISIVVPTYNEAQTVPVLARRLQGALGEGEWELVVVDDGSPDGTADIAASLAPELPVRVVRRPGKLGLASAAMDGWAEARGDVLAVMDADLSHPPESVPALVEAPRTGADSAAGRGAWSRPRTRAVTASTAGRSSERARS